ncbi:PVC-type heme-binding CxxCH protein [Haloferula sp. BvORR071]|uniref:PVC-type heme-binding CxxCH protein n=1 Tax=Haloferula sp. BvORR071 TaxID=1396141 RepID=UPI00054E5C99|nr:PVC-type heme-binding CxxCH protein [Haloferula sp. BvORR071]
MNGSVWFLLPLLTSVAHAAPETYPCQNGLVRSLVAREPMFMNPVAVAVDTDGTIYVTETTRRKQADLDIREIMAWVPEDLSHTSVEDKRDFFHRSIDNELFRKHPSLKDHDKNGQIDWHDLTVHSEKIHRLVDTDGDGVADKATVFAEGFNTEVTGIAAGVLARHGDVYATIIPDVWKLRDTNGDGVADERKAIASGFGVHINYAGHDMHGLIFGPDGKLYWTIGDKGTNVVNGGKRWFYPHEGALLRCNPDGSDFEVFARGLRNVQQIAFDDYGNIFGVDNDSDQKGEKERLVYIVEGSDTGWRCYYQYRGGKYNPWMDERIAFPDGEDRPAAILPPLSLYLDGPSGFAHNPGTALNERYRDHFFLTQFPAGKINSFKLEPDGAAYKMADDHLMASGTPFVGCNFGPDGALYVADWQGGYPLKEKGALWKIDDPAAAGSAVRKEVAAMLKEGAGKAKDEELLERLGHVDQRVRLDAQWELARRTKWQALIKEAGTAKVPQIARIHALWGLSQGKQFDASLFSALIKEPDPELRAQAAKWAGECQATPSALGPLLGDLSPRVRFQAAIAIGKAGMRNQADAILAMLSENAGKDAYLTHAGSRALSHFIDEALATKITRHPSTAVRLAGVVALRNSIEDSLRKIPAEKSGGGESKSFDAHKALALFLSDAEPAVVAEAARSIYETAQGEQGVAPLAPLLEAKPEPRVSALRRSISANRRIGDEAALLRLATYAADAKRPTPLRTAALEALASVRSSELLDSVDGHFSPTPAVDLAPALAAKLAGMITPLGRDAAVAKAASAALDALGVEQDLATLAKQAADPQLDPGARIRALWHLKNSRAPQWADLAEALLRQESPALRSAAADALSDERPKLILDYVRQTGLKSPDTTERQIAVRLLLFLPDSKAVLDGLVGDLGTGKLDPAIQLEVIECASNLQLDSIHEAEAALAVKGGLAKWSYALAGGNADAGKKVFETNLAANCTACHRVGEEGSNVGPPLSEIGKKERSYLLQSLLDPQAVIAPGFGMMTLTKKDGSAVAGTLAEEKDGVMTLQLPDGSKTSVPAAEIATKTPPVSPMPPMGEILKPQELRDLLEYLASLK